MIPAPAFLQMPSLPDWDWTGLGTEIGLGALAGFAVGYTAKKALKLVLIFIALMLLLAVALETHGIITVHWQTLEAGYSKAVRPEVLMDSFERLGGYVGRVLPASGGFVLGCVLGFKRG
jgi:uncharacterized membrane protein (Fun14 family)